MLTLAATVVLVLYTQTLSALADDAVAGGGPRLDRFTVAVHYGARCRWSPPRCSPSSSPAAVPALAE
ncbi:hypothetical protein ASC77_12605 [Nocardioides sp. Root1257]|nr:hypothetical protein ASC77_12605 [Nocardioides sp. Root1257]KRC45466.1 hypothetical protein ASE24_12610 [Nocardioides sp. Root224]